MRTQTVLIVDDEPASRRLIKSILQREGYKALEAANALQALVIAVNHRSPIDLLVAGAELPGIDGRRLLEKFSQTFPTTPAALLSKPLQPDSLVQTVRELLMAPPPRKQPAQVARTASLNQRTA